ncbi:hypothetical protein GW791_04130, partial [Candidatus Saccharibacteria bacterium]|nr:hypothetical protein [Candidatus Saccharibacteria bacterium]
CPSDSKVAAGTVCRAANGVCNPAETCNGSSSSCPADANTNGTLCAASRGVCENDRYCSSGVCPASYDYKSSSTKCSDGSPSGASGICMTTDSDRYCLGSDYRCLGSIINILGYASSNGQVWNGSSWVTASYAGVNAGYTGYDYCSGQLPQRGYYGCVAGSNSTTVSGYGSNVSACNGDVVAEHSMCQSGSCLNKCLSPYNPGDNDGDGFLDNQDSDCSYGGCGECTSGACCDTSTGCYLPSSSPPCGYTAFGVWGGDDGVCRIQRSRGIYKCTGTSSTCSTGVSGTDYEYANISSGYVWWNNVSQVTSNSIYCGVTSGMMCSGQQPLGMVKACNGSNSCSFTDDNHFAAVGSACNGTTQTCSNGVCVACPSGYRDYDKDGYGAGTYGTYCPSAS